MIGEFLLYPLPGPPIPLGGRGWVGSGPPPPPDGGPPIPIGEDLEQGTIMELLPPLPPPLPPIGLPIGPLWPIPGPFGPIGECIP